LKCSNETWCTGFLLPPDLLHSKSIGGKRKSLKEDYFFFLWRLALLFFLRLWVAIFLRFLFFPEGIPSSLLRRFKPKF